MTCRVLAAVIRIGICTLLVLVPCAARAQVPGELRGRVSDARTARAIAAAQIDIVGRTERATTITDGSYVVRGLEPGAYSIRVRAVGYAARDYEVDIANGRATQLDVALQAVATELGTVVVEAPRAALPAGAITFDRRAIEASGRRDIGELLQTAPGVVITQMGGPGSPSRVSIRGSSAHDVLVVVDGVSVNSSITGEADLSHLSREAVERVTVLPGAQSARYGGRALAGVIAIETRRPQREASATTGAGAWGERAGGVAIGSSRPWNAWHVGGSLAADLRTTRGDFMYEVPAVRGGGTARRENAGATSGNVLVGASLDGDHGSLRMRAGWQSTTRGLVGSIVQPSLTGEQNDHRLAGGIDGQWRSGRFAWTSSVDLTSEHAAFADPHPPFSGPFDDVVDAHGMTASGTGTASSPFGAAMIGAEARTLGVTSTMLDGTAPHSQRLFGTWASLRGSRALAHDIEVAGDVSARLDWNSLIDGTTLSPRATVTMSRGVLSVSASAGNGYAPPSLGDQFFHEGVLVRPNPDLQPERVRGEIEARLAVREIHAGPFDIGGEMARYRANIDGMILWMPDFRFIWSPTNFDVHRSGWDTSMRVAAPSIGADLRGTLSRADVGYTGPVLSGQVAYRPRTNGSVSGGVEHWGARLDLTTRYVGERRTVGGSALNVLESYWLTDVKVAVPLVRARWTLDATVGVANILDRSASMLVDYPFPGRTWTISLRTRRGDASQAITARPHEP